MDLGANEWSTFRKVTLPLIAPGILAAGAARVRALDRRLRDHVLQRRLDDHVPAVRLGRRARRDAAADQRDRHGDLRRRRHRLMLANIVVSATLRALEQHEHAVDRDVTRGACSRPRATTSGCTSRAWAAYGDGEVPIIVRGDGCYLEDANGKRYLDALAGPVRRADSATRTATRSARRRTSRCASCRSTPTGRTRIRARSSSPPRSRALAPGDLNRVFFVSGGSEAVESAWKLARQYHTARGERRWKAIARRRRLPRHDDGRALDQRHRRRCARRSSRSCPTSLHVRNTNRYHRPPGETEEEFTAFLLDDLEHDDHPPTGPTRSRW